MSYIPMITGNSTLAAGNVTVSTPSVRANSIILLSNHNGVLTNLGILSIGTIVAGTSFVVNSSNILDTSTFMWTIIGS